jgi:hypothetical protein
MGWNASDREIGAVEAWKRGTRSNALDPGVTDESGTHRRGKRAEAVSCTPMVGQTLKIGLMAVDSRDIVIQASEI